MCVLLSKLCLGSGNTPSFQEGCSFRQILGAACTSSILNRSKCTHIKVGTHTFLFIKMLGLGFPYKRRRSTPPYSSYFSLLVNLCTFSPGTLDLYLIIQVCSHNSLFLIFGSRAMFLNQFFLATLSIFSYQKIFIIRFIGWTSQ